MKKIILIAVSVIGGIILVLAGLAAWYTWPGDDSEIRAQADAIRVPDTWEITSEKVVPPIRLCLEKSGCPSIMREWKLDRIYTKDELQEIFMSTGVEIPFEEECKSYDKSSSSGSSPLCMAYGSNKTHDYTVYEGVYESGSVILKVWIKEN